MTRRKIRLTIVGMTATLLLVAMTGCFFGGGEEPEPTATPDLAATIAAAVGAAVPTDTPVPTEAPDLDATLQAMIAATQAAMPPTATPVPPTNTPIPPTETPVPTATPVPPTNTPMPTNTPVPTQRPTPGPSDQPCIIAGNVTIGGSIPPAGTPVYAVSQTGDDLVVAEDTTNTAGVYRLAIPYFNEAFDIFVRSDDSGVDTPVTMRGCRQIRNLNIP